ncbi:MAG: putative keto/oxoacid ferredoxin oxidoreductase, alpha subunit [Peptococcaceae bacterium]|nr:putative keto/oxoacid ferredoxin oxidoreductase, alpha subunit [Peptococcaceae bacterium]
MAEKILMKGSEAIAEAAIRNGCRYFFGYPITPQNEIPEYLAKRLPEVGGTFLQAESEVAAIYMVLGAGAAGARVMTSSSSPGISLKQEGISYMAGAEVPCVIVNIMRGGPGLGAIQGAQPDYWQATRGGGHGDYRLLVLAPATVQEAVNLTYEAFDLADKYRNPVMILGDGILAQIMEPVELPEENKEQPEKTWAVCENHNRPRNIVSSSYPQVDVLEQINLRLHKRYNEIKNNEVRWDSYLLDDAEYVIVAYGSAARIAKAAVKMARAEGIKAGLLRPVSVWPFPVKPFQDILPQVKAFLALEMCTGQMIDDVRLAIGNARPVHHYGRLGGVIPLPEEVLGKLKELVKEGK